MNEGLEALGIKWGNGEDELRGLVFAKSGIEHIKIPSTLKIIDAYTFFGCKKLKKVVCHDPSVNIMEFAFYKCKNLEKFIIKPNEL